MKCVILNCNEEAAYGFKACTSRHGRLKKEIDWYLDRSEDWYDKLFDADYMNGLHNTFSITGDKIRAVISMSDLLTNNN